MTTGSWTIGSTVNGTMHYESTTYPPTSTTVIDPFSTAFKIGYKATKTWSGADAPKLEKTRPKETFWKMSYIDRKGRIQYKTMKAYNPRKRDTARRNQPHAYSMSFASTYNPSATITDSGVRTLPDGTVTGYIKTYSRASPTFWTGGSFPHFGIPAFSPNDDILLVNRLVESIRGSSFNLAVMLGESNETLHMLALTARRLVYAYRAARKGQIYNASRLLVGKKDARQGIVHNSPEANWLELKYGWLPLLQDIDNAAKMLAHQLYTPFVQSYRVRHKVKSDQNVWNGTQPFHWSNRYAFTSKSLVAYISEPPRLYDTLGLSDPASYLWELTPLSFVADWITPIGDYLTARAAAGTLKGTFVNTKFQVQHCGGFVGKTLPPNNVWAPNYLNSASTSNGDAYERNVNMTRTVVSNLVVPMPVVKPFSKALSWQHAVSGVALVIQGFKQPSRLDKLVLDDSRRPEQKSWLADARKHGIFV